ncbi:DUF6119 family protein [Spartinivicinus poritis]|uniref:TIGR04141 family sporadically distributed protein n=1 Tax=Spartinivicinus poritis TaxID=2994640 RepID=A0ABT5U3I7_9GAMM|nr:DUF6119 family protein [Spartinivicinus sp. A2-2]MDE1460925.1 TIGR04141 family sporadically distributed protein [Spartinivicinus sp. A2-2]
MIYIKGKSSKKYRLVQFSTAEIFSFFTSDEIKSPKDLDDLKIVANKEDSPRYTKPLKYYLDFIDDENKHCLIEGIWHQFNQSYVDYLKNEVDKIEINYDEEFNIPRSIPEEKFNKDREEKNGYINCDTQLTGINKKYRVEKMDLYKDGGLFFVKKGTAQKLNYVIDQAITTIKILQQKESKIEIDGEEKKIKVIVLWFILERKTVIKHLSEINSIILHNKLAEWRQLSLSADYTPIVYINYLTDKSTTTK